MDNDPNQDDESLALALALHRELNASSRRSRRDAPPQPKRQLSRKLDEVEASSASEEEEDQGDAGGPAERPQKQKGAAARRAKRRKPGPKPPLEPHEAAAAAVVQKAAKAGRAKGGGITGRSHFKCFLTGLPWGVILHRDALNNKESLAIAVSRAFERDGVSCKAADLDVTIVTSNKEVEHFGSLASSNGSVKAAEKQDGDEERKNKAEGEEERWAEAAQQAQRVYISRPQ